MKFGLLIKTDIRKTATSPDLKPEAGPWSPVSDNFRLVHKYGHLSVIVAYATPQPTVDADKDSLNQIAGLSIVSAIPPEDIASWETLMQ